MGRNGNRSKKEGESSIAIGGAEAKIDKNWTCRLAGGCGREKLDEEQNGRDTESRRYSLELATAKCDNILTAFAPRIGPALASRPIQLQKKLLLRNGIVSYRFFYTETITTR